MEPDFDLVDGEFFRIVSEFVANDAPSLTQLLSSGCRRHYNVAYPQKCKKKVILWKDGRRIAFDI